MQSTLRTTARAYEDFLVRHGSELATLYKQTLAAGWKITEVRFPAAEKRLMDTYEYEK